MTGILFTVMQLYFFFALFPEGDADSGKQRSGKGNTAPRQNRDIPAVIIGNKRYDGA